MDQRKIRFAPAHSARTALLSLGVAACGALDPAAEAAFVEMQVETTTTVQGGSTYHVFKVYAKFNSSVDTVLNAFGMSATPAGRFWHIDFLNGSTFSNAAGTWSPSLLAAPNAGFDGWVTIGGDNTFGNSTSADPGWGPPSWNQAGIPAGAGWANINPPNLQGRVDPTTLRTLVAQFVMKDVVVPWTTAITIGFNQGLGTPADFATSSFTLGIADLDGDGIPDQQDNCPTVANSNQANSDSDSFGNACDNCPTVANNDQANSDGDAVGNVCDNCPSAANSDQANSDSDSFGNACDNCPSTTNQNQADSDGDTAGNLCDNCPNVPNPGQANGDGDTVGDACDNCPGVTNQNQADIDSDGTGNACEPADFLGWTTDRALVTGGNIRTRVFAVFSGANGTVLNTYHPHYLSGPIGSLAAGNFRHIDALNGNSASFTAGTWNPTLVLANNAETDSFVTIGGSPADFGNTTAADPGWGIASWNQAGIPDTAAAGVAGWFNGNPQNLQGRCNPDTLRTLVMTSVSPIQRFGTIRLNLGFNRGLSTGSFFDDSTVILGDPTGDADLDGAQNATDNCPLVANPSQADCDGDGVGDACETDPDVNLNGVRDTCESGPLVFSVPQNFSTIGAAITAATPGSIVRVGPGTYAARIDFGGKAITVESVAGPAATILDGGGQPGAIVSFVSGETASSILRGFTVRNGQGGSALPLSPSVIAGGGLLIHQSSPTIQDCVIENCSAPWGGGAVLHRSAAAILGCTFRDNTATAGGGGIFIVKSFGALVENCVLEDNQAPEGGAVLCDSSSATLRGTDLTANRADGDGSAVRQLQTDPAPTGVPLLGLEDCDVSFNVSDSLGAAIRAHQIAPPALRLAATSVCDNVAVNVAGPYLDGGGNLVCCVGDIDLDGSVDAKDLARILFAWGLTGSAAGDADLDFSGEVDGTDLAIVIGSWGGCD